MRALFVALTLRWLLAASPAERSALDALYAATEGEGWANKSGWLGAGDPCEWFGVACAGGTVLELSMQTFTDASRLGIGNSMAGTLPSQLSGVAGLAALFLFDNRISGTMPTELMELTRLKALELSNAPPDHSGYHSAAPLPMSGTVPTQIAALEGLRELGLGQYSSLSGTLPFELQSLTSLSMVYCDANSVSGTVPLQLAALGELSVLSFADTSLSGTIPSQLSELKALATLALDLTPLSGTVPTQFGELKTLTELLLGNTSLSGTVPTQLAELTTLTNLDLETTSISGTLPSSFGALPALATLGLYDMRLSGTVPASVLRRCLPFGPVQCDGLPPFSCSAFGLERSRLSLTSVGKCVHCPSHDATVAKVSLSLVLLPLAVALYIWAVDRFPRFKTWIASVSLILSHLQIVGLLSSLTSVQSLSPGGVFATLQAALLVCIDLGTVDPQCLLDPQPVQLFKKKMVVNKDGTSSEGIYAIFDPHAFLTSPAVVGTATACALAVVAFLALTLAKLAAKRRPPPTTVRTAAPLPPPPQQEQQQAEAPAADDEEVMAADEAAAPEAALVPPPDATQASDSLGDDASAKAAAAATLALVDKYESWTVIIFSLQLPTLFRVGLRTTVLGTYGDLHYSLCVGVPVVFVELAYALKLFRHMRALEGRMSCFGWRHTALPQERLRARLRYLTGRYAEHAPHWQFVLWTRQLAVIGIDVAFDSYDDTAMVLVEAAATFAVLSAALALHWHTRPYAYGYQNKAEVVMSLSSMLAIVYASFGYWRRADLTDVPASLFAVGLVGMLLGPVVLFSVWLAVARPSHKPAAELRAALLQINADSAPAPPVTPSRLPDVAPPRVDSEVGPGHSCVGVTRMSKRE